MTVGAEVETTVEAELKTPGKTRWKNCRKVMGVISRKPKLLSN